MHSVEFAAAFIGFFLGLFHFRISSMQENRQNIIWLLFLFWLDVSLSRAWKSSYLTDNDWLDKCSLQNVKHEKACKACVPVFSSELAGSTKGHTSASTVEAKG